MSVSMRSTKAQMYSEIERLRDYADRYQQQLRDAVDEIARLKAALQPRNSAPSTKQSLAQFCAAYCQTHGTRSVPGHVVHAWRNAQ